MSILLSMARTAILTLVVCVFAVQLSPAHGQATLDDDYDLGVPTEDPNYDGGGVDILSGGVQASSPSVSIGPAGGGGLSYQRVFSGGNWRHGLMGGMRRDNLDRVVSVGGASERFVPDGSSGYDPEHPTGSALVNNSGTWTYTRSDGTQVEFLESLVSNIYPIFYGWNSALVSKITQPSGLEITFGYHSTTYQGTGPFGFTSLPDTIYRLDSVRTNAGYQLHFEYDADVTVGIDDTGGYFELVKVTALNNTIDVCAVGGPCTGLSQSWPTLEISEAAGSGSTLVYSFETALGDVTEVTIDEGHTPHRLSSIKSPEATTANLSYTYDSNGRVATRVAGPLTTSYGYVDISSTERETTVTHPGGATRTMTGDPTTGLISSTEDGLGNITEYYYDTHERIDRIVAPEGQETHFTYDARGNITETRQVAIAGSGLADLVQTATYPTSCTNPVICNRPTSTTDVAGNTTDYTYDATHGGLLTMTLPAPTAGADRPRTQVFYATHEAYYKLTAGGSVTASGDPIYLPTRVSSCRAGAAGACYNTPVEQRMTMDYGPQTGPANNLHAVSETAQLGNGTLAQTTSFTHDEFGNVTIVDGPVSGTNDRVHMRYDMLRRQVGMIGPDPDGAGPLHRAAQRFTFDGDGRTVEQELGTVNGVDNTAWAAFSRTQRQVVDYDAIGRVTEARAYAAGTTIEALVQRSYNSAGQLLCTAQRMNPAIYASPPSSACSLGTTGTSGPDRITRYTYDLNGRVRVVTEGYGTADQGIEVDYRYTANGQLYGHLDGEGNWTRYIYDGHDRLLETNFANKTGGGVNWSDDVIQTYDSAGRVATRRVRTNEVFSYTYDALGRVTNVTAPSGTASSTFTYDNFNNVLSISDGTDTLTNSYNAMGQHLSQTQKHGTVSYQYDAAGRRSRMTWPDGFYVTYDWNDVSQLTHIRENGASSGLGVLATFEYDELGRRTRLLRGNGTETRYDFDAMGRLDELVTDLAGTADDNTDSFTFNPAGQIASRSRTNTDYSYASHINVDTLFTHNGLNQIDTVSTATNPTYDGRGNLTSDGTRSYTYDTYNRMTSATTPSGTATMDYDPLGRIDDYVNMSGVDIGFIWDGWDQIGYAIGGSVVMHMVHGPGTNEPLLEYSSTMTRTWLHADAQGSIVAHTNDAGTLTQTNRYDEYGNPAPTNSGQFQYTGHLWLVELDLHYAKNRMYDPRLMRFLTTDPIGVSGGMNLYAYVGGDPVNYVDPLGLEPQDRILVKGTRPSCPIGAICDSDDIGRFMDQFTSVDQLISPDLMELIGDVAGGEESSGDGERECDETSLPSDEMGPEQRMSWIGGPLNSYLDSRTELAYWNHYKTGSGLDVRMGSAEFGRAASYAENVLAEAGRGQHGRGTIGVSFYGNAEFNGVLGSATVEYSNGFVIGIYDFYNFDPKSLGDRPSPTHEIATRLGRLAAGPNQEPFSIRGGLWSCP